MFGINGGELLVLALLAVLVVGPERLPGYAEQLGRGVRTLRGFLRSTRERVAEELGEEAADVDWSQLDPRRYDPRRIVRDALLDEDPPPVTGRRYTTGRVGRGAAAAVATSGLEGAQPADLGDRPSDAASPGAQGVPFDDEAT